MNNPQYIYSMYKLSKIYPWKASTKRYKFIFLPGAKIGIGK